MVKKKGGPQQRDGQGSSTQPGQQIGPQPGHQQQPASGAGQASQQGYPPHQGGPHQQQGPRDQRAERGYQQCGRGQIPQGQHYQQGPRQTPSHQPPQQAVPSQTYSSLSSQQSWSKVSAAPSTTQQLAPAWGKKVEPSPIPLAQPVAAPPADSPAAAVKAPQPTTAKPVEGKKKGKQTQQSTAPPSMQPVAAPQAQPSAPLAQPSIPAVEPLQPTPAEAKPAEGKKKGKQTQQLTAPPSMQPVAAPLAQPSAPLAQPSAPAVEALQPTPAEAKPAGGKKKGKGRGQATQTAAPAGPLPSVSAAIGDVVKKTAHLTVKTYPIPKRKEHKVKHVDFMKKIWIEVNYLPLKIKNPQLKIYHYDVHFNPDKPKYLLRPALEVLRKKHFGDRHPAFDGMKNMYVAAPKLQLTRDELRDTVTVLNKESGRDKEYDIVIKLVNEDLNIGRLFEYCQKGITSSSPQTEIQATDVALRSGLTTVFTPAGRSFFAKPTEPEILGDGMELWHGFYQSAVMAWKPYLNVDVANKAFPIEQPVLHFLQSDTNLTLDELKKNGLQNYQRENLRKFLKGLKVEYEMPASRGGQVQKRTYKVDGLGGTPLEEKFKPKDDGPQISVGMYYSREKNYQIHYEKLPLIKIGTKGSMVPLELCKIIGNQAVMRKLNEKQTAAMVKAAARPTFERKERIDRNIGLAQYEHNPTLREFGIEIQTSFEKVEAVVMKAPKIAYQRNAVDVRDGVWRMDREKFITAQEMPSWAVLNLNQRSQRCVIDLERMMQTTGGNVGMNVPPPQRSVVDPSYRITEQDIVKHLTNFEKNGVRLVFVVLSQADDVYGMVKRASELRVGVLTQCLRSRTLEKMNPMTATNILLKVNSKLKGVNHIILPTMKPDIMKCPFMFVGADVTHPAPGPGAENTPSIAAVAASHDKHGFQYKMMYRLQPSREEMIIELADIMKALLESFKITLGILPQKILYFRDGVSEGQFQMVLSVELEAIRRACMQISPDYKPAVTFLVVQKRHHTRFFPNPRDGDYKNCNVPAGTLVDSDITHPTEVDFYLVSHKSIQGTARPTKYHLLHDDSEIPQVELEKLTYYLCHMFSRCTRSVSYPAPTYYAHLAAFRARAWWDRMNVNMAALRKEQDERGAISMKITDNYPMFFV